MLISEYGRSYYARTGIEFLESSCQGGSRKLSIETRMDYPMEILGVERHLWLASRRMHSHSHPQRHLTWEHLNQFGRDRA